MVIEDLSPGDWVWSYDTGRGEWALCEVAATHGREVETEMATIQYELADGTTHTIRATGNHPFLVTGGAELSSRPRCVELGPEAGDQPGGRWLAARHLRVGDRLRLKLSEGAMVTQVTLRLEKLHVHNLTVLRVHNFAVGVGGVIAHNTSNKGVQQACAKIELRVNGRTISPDVSFAGDIARNSERAIKEAKEALKRNKDFSRWFHREYKPHVKVPGKRSNPDLADEDVLDAFELWNELGRPAG